MQDEINEKTVAISIKDVYKRQTVSSIENEYCQFEFWLPKVSTVPALGKEPQKLRDGKEKNADKG